MNSQGQRGCERQRWEEKGKAYYDRLIPVHCEEFIEVKGQKSQEFRQLQELDTLQK